MNDSGEASSGLRNRPPGLAPELRQLQDAGDVDRRWWETADSSKPSARTAASPETDSDQPSGWGFGPPPPPPPAPFLKPDQLRPAGPRPQPAAAPEPATTRGSPVAAESSRHGAAAAAQTDGCTDTAASTMTSTQANATAQAAGAAQAQAEALAMQRLELELAAARAEAAALHEMLEDLPEIFERKFRQRLQSTLEQQQRLLADNQALREQVYTLTPAAPAVETRPSRLLLPASQPNSLGEALRKVLRLGRSHPPAAIDPDRCG